MKKSLKITLIIIGALIGFILLDTIQALVFNRNTIIGSETKCMRREGIFVNTYHCGNGKHISKLKFGNSSCNSESVCGGIDSIMTNKIALSLKDNTLTSKGATFVMTNNSNIDTYEYGNPYYLEIKKNDEWEKLETINQFAFTMETYGLKPNKTKEFKINWEYGYGELKSGTYRLVKDAFRSGDEPIDESEKIYLYAEFTIE